MGLVKVAFLWELLGAGFSVLISDLDVVWVAPHWARWMTWTEPTPPVAEAGLIALADVLVTTDELSASADLRGVRPGAGTDLNTGVVYFRGTVGSRAMVQTWRKAMLRRKGGKDLNENVNDQSLFNQVVRGGELGGDRLEAWARTRNATAATRALKSQNARRVYETSSAHEPCLPDAKCDGVRFSFGTLPMRPFSGGHTWFNQNVAAMPGAERPEHAPVTVHFTFQFGDTGDYPHGKRQRAREAALWAVDPPEYFTEGVFVALAGPTYSAQEQAAVYARFPEWSPQRHMFMDAPQRRAVRDLLALATAAGGITVLPKLWCHCDRYWGFLRNCRFPHVPSMPLPFGCPQDALYDPTRWNKKGVKWREHTFLANEHVPETLKTNKVTVAVADAGAAAPPAPQPGARAVTLPFGATLREVHAAVLKANPAVRVIEVASAADLRRMKRTLGDASQDEKFNKLCKYILTESSRYCPQEDMGGYGGPGFNWQNPFTAYNCTWGFHHPALYPLAAVDERPGGGMTTAAAGAAAAAGGVRGFRPLGAPWLAAGERGNSTTCPRQMLCDYNTLEDGRETKPITWCNIEGYNGMDQRFLGAARGMLSKMPDGRCTYPPGDKPGMLGFDKRGHYVGGEEVH